MRQDGQTGAIFDLDGTLLDSMGVWEEIDRRFLEKRRIAPSRDYTDAVKAMGFLAAARYTIARFHLNEPPEALMDEWTEMARDMYAHEIPMKPGAAAYLRQLADRGVRLGIATSSKEALFRPALERFGVWELFCAATTVTEVSRGKEGPEIYLETARRMGLRPECCTVYEDLLPGIQAAKAAGFSTVAVYDPSSASEEPALCRTADRYIRSFSELAYGAQCDCYDVQYRGTPVGVLLVDRTSGQHCYDPLPAGTAWAEARTPLPHEMAKGTDGFTEPIPFLQNRLWNMARYGLDEIGYHTDYFVVRKR